MSVKHFNDCHILFHHRYTEEDEFLKAATFLDPRFKRLPYLSSSERKSVTTYIRQEMFRIHLSTQPTASSADTNSVETRKLVYIKQAHVLRLISSTMILLELDQLCNCPGLTVF